MAHAFDLPSGGRPRRFTHEQTEHGWGHFPVKSGYPLHLRPYQARQIEKAFYTGQLPKAKLDLARTVGFALLAVDTDIVKALEERLGKTGKELVALVRSLGPSVPALVDQTQGLVPWLERQVV